MYKKISLKNGLTVILAPKLDSKSVALFYIFKVGSRHEQNAQVHGISHFVEHLMFKGTKKRPNTLTLSKVLDGIGAEFNAYTAKDHTAYHIKANADNLDLAGDILSDILHNSLLKSQEIEKEKGVIIEEIKMYEDQPIQYAEILLESLLFKGSALEHNIAGTRESVSQMTRNDIVNYIGEHYYPQNSVLVIAGKINNNLQKVLNKYFVQPALSAEPAKSKIAPLKNEQKEPRIILSYKDTKQAHIALGFSAYSYFDSRLYASYLLATILGGSMSSRLFINVRERQGLCYYIRAQSDVYEDTGDLMIRSGLDITKLKKGVSIIAQNLKDIKNKGITAEELAKAKSFINGRLTLQLEDLNDLAEFYGREFLLANELLTPEQKIKKIMSVTKLEVNKAAQDIFKLEKMNLAMISPFKNKNEILKLIKL